MKPQLAAPPPVRTGKSPAERQRDFRARKAEQSLTEVRGIFAHPEDHPKIKSQAARVIAARAKAQQAS
jgi:hypothetical protein